MNKAFEQLVLVGEIERSGRERRSLQRRFQTGELVRIRRGAYIPTQIWKDMAPWERYRVEVAAISCTFPVPPIFCDTAAAITWGLPSLLSTDEITILLTGDTATTSGVRRSGVRASSAVRTLPPGFQLRRRRADIPSDRIVVRHGVTVTDSAQTLLDLAVYGKFTEAVMALDHAFRHPLEPPHTVTKAQLLSAVQNLPHAAKRSRALRAIEFTDPLSESAGESLSRAQIHVLGLPTPTLQHAVFDAEGFVARTDYYWKEFGLIGEFDGKVKYTRNGGAKGTTTEEIVYREKLREDRIRATGLSVVRWDWATAMNPNALRNKLHAAGLVTSRVPGMGPFETGAPQTRGTLVPNRPISGIV